MAVSYKTGFFTKSTNTSTPVDQAATGIGFTPKALILFGSQTTTDAAINTNAITQIGFTDGTTDKCIFASAQDGQATSDTHRYSGSAKLYSQRSANNGALLAECDIKTLDADGFTLTWTTNTTAVSRINYIAIGGDDITGVEVGSFNNATGIQTQNVSTGLDTADFVMLMNTANSLEDSVSSELELAIGMATSSSNQGNSTITSQNSVTTTKTQRYLRSDQILTNINTNNTGKFLEGSFDGFTSSGFDIDWTVANFARDIYYLTIKGGQWEVGNGTFPTSATTKAFTTSFRPKGLLNFGVGNTTSTSVESHAKFHLGAADGTDDAATSIRDENGISVVSDCSRTSISSKCIRVLDTTAGALDDEAELDSFNATDFTLDFTTNAGTAKEFIWAVVGDNASAGVSPSTQAVIMG